MSGLRARSLWLVFVLASTGCSSLPVIVPDMAVSREPVKVEGTNGRMLSVRQSKAVLEKLKAGGTETSIFERHLAVEQAIAGNPLTTGNAAVLLEDGPATYAAMFEAIHGARDHINLETYILEDDETGRRFADALIDKQQRGVQVNLIHDGVGTLGTPREFFTRLTDAGINVLEFNPVNPLTAKAGWDVNNRDHRKLLVVDGQTAFLGGINISAVYSGGSSSRVFGSASEGQAGKRANAAPGSTDSKGAKEAKDSKDATGAPDAKVLPWRDTDLQVSGPVVADLQKFFIETWEQQQGKPLAPRNYFPKLSAQGNEVIRAIASSPDEPFSLIYATFISAINSAESEILLTNAYFVPDPQLVDALLTAVARGVDVKMVLPGTSDSWLVFRAGRAHYDRLLRGGVKLYEREHVLLHSKTALIDGVWSTIGSTNLDWRSFLHNQEVNAVILGPEFGAQMRASFDHDVAASRRITLQDWERRPISDRVKELFGRLWEYWL